MFKFFKVGGADGQSVNQTITALPAGNYNWSFYTQWNDAGHANGPTGTAPGNLPSWSAEGDNQPKFTILVQDADGAWVADQATVTTEPTTVLTWVQDSGTWTNTETRDVRIKFAKNGGTAANGGSNTDKLMYIDDASLAYASGLTSSTESIPWSDDLEIDLSNFTTGQVGDTDANWAVTTARANSGAQSVFHDDANAASGYDNYLLTPTFDLSGATAPLLTYWDNVNYTTYAEAHEVLVSEDFTNDVATATWTVLNSTIGTEDTWVENEFALPISATVTVAFRYTGDYASEWYLDDIMVAETPTAPAMVATATTDGSSATFSFDIANFTVGAAPGEGDGHIHWSIFAASDLNTPIYDNVMVYSDDYTLTDLPNGDHVIVFSLVDANHQPLDPAVEATVEFSTFDGTAACGETVTYTQVANGDYTVAATAPAGEVASVTVNGTTESGWDFLNVTDGAGNALNADQNTGTFTDAVYSSTDGTISVNILNDGSVNSGDITLAFACAGRT